MNTYDNEVRTLYHSYVDIYGVDWFDDDSLFALYLIDRALIISNHYIYL